MDWQPISTAPRTGKRIMLGGDNIVSEGWWARDETRLFGDGPVEGWAIELNCEFDEHVFVDWATHWQPLPKPPRNTLKVD